LRLAPYDWKTYQDMGMVMLTLGRRPDAIEHLESAARLNPRAIEAINTLGGVLLESGRVEDAVEHFRTVLRLDPGFARAHDNLGSAFASQGRLDEALTHYREAIRWNPADPRTRYNLGRVFFLQQDFDAAIREYAEAVRLAPDLSPARAGLADALFRRGMLRVAQGETHDAVQHWREALQTLPDHRESLNALAWTMATSRDDEIRKSVEALELAEQVVQLTERRSPEALDTLAAAHAANGRFTEAIQTARQALEIAEATGNQKLIEAIRSHLETYLRGEALRN
jgi:tetratricopeptide (TPR) repeat protein